MKDMRKALKKTTTMGEASLPDLSLESSSLQIPSGNGECKSTW